MKLFFTVGNTAFDTFIASWKAKRCSRQFAAVDAGAPLLQGQEGARLGGAGQGRCLLPAEDWHPYSPLTFITPPFPGYRSGHSTVSGGCGKILELFTGSDHFGGVEKRKAGELTEPGFVCRIIQARHGKMLGDPKLTCDVALKLPTFSATAELAGLSHVMGGYHIQSDNVDGLALGRKVAVYLWPRIQAYFNGRPGRAEARLLFAMHDGAVAHKIAKTPLAVPAAGSEFRKKEEPDDWQRSIDRQKGGSQRRRPGQNRAGRRFTQAFQGLEGGLADAGVNIPDGGDDSPEQSRRLTAALAEGGDGMAAYAGVGVFQGGVQERQSVGTEPAQGDASDDTSDDTGVTEQYDEVRSCRHRLGADFAEGEGGPATGNVVGVLRGHGQGRHRLEGSGPQFAQTVRGPAAHCGRAVAQGSHQNGHGRARGRTDLAQGRRYHAAHGEVVVAQGLDEGRHRSLRGFAHQPEHGSRVQALEGVGHAQALQPVAQVRPG